MTAKDVKNMVQRVEWFSRIDYYIWEFYTQHDISITPGALATNIEYDNDYVGKRLRRMERAGLLEQVKRGHYAMTDLGRQFVRGELSDADLDELDPDAE